MKLGHLLLGLICVAATSCMGNRYPYTSFNSIPEEGWAYNDTIQFPVTLTESVADGELLIDITHDNTYPYSNLWVEITMPVDSVNVSRDTIEVTLCDYLGKWYGRGIEGLYQLETLAMPAISLKDSTCITLRHIMRTDTIHGISRVGLTLRKI